MTDRFSECLEIFELRSDFYKGIDIKIAAVQSEKNWFNLRAKILAIDNKNPTENEMPINLKDFRILHTRVPADKFSKLLTDIKSGISEIGGMKINFFSDPIPSLNREDYCRGDSGRSKERWNIDWPLDLFEWNSNHTLHQQLADIYKEIDMKLRCFETPYKDIEEAILELLQLPKYLFIKNQARDSRCSVLLPNFVTIESAKLEGNNLDVSAKFHESIPPKDLFLSIIGYGRKTTRFREDFKGGELGATPPFMRISKSFKVVDVADVQLFIFSRKMEKYGHCDQKTARNIKARLNLRVASHEVFDRESSKLRERLVGKAKKDAKRSFEHAVVTLLNMCGFRTEWLDFPGIAQDAPDILAIFSEPELVVVGECSNKVPDRNKYELLKERSERIEDQLRTRVIAVMFISRNVSLDEKTKFWSHNITLISPKELVKLHDMATRAKPINEIIDILTGRHW